MHARRARPRVFAPSVRIVPLALFGALFAPVTAPAKTFVLPHVLEVAGKTIATPYTFDTMLHLVYTQGQVGIPPGGGSAVADLYLYENNGTVMTHNTVPVCAPCTFVLNGTTRKQTIVIDDLISAAGGPFTSGVKLGFGVLVVGGADPKGISTQVSIVNSHSGPQDLSTFAFESIAPPSQEPCAGGEYAFSIPHIFETEGSTTTMQYAWDTTLYADYVGGLPGLPGSGGANLDLYLFANDGGYLSNNGQDVCAPCNFPLTAIARKQTIQIDNLILATGAFDTSVKQGYGIAVVGGTDPVNVALQVFVANSHTGPFDLSIHGFEPVPIAATASVSAPPLEPGRQVRALSVMPNPAGESIAFSYELAQDTEVDLSIYDPAGRKIAILVSGRGEAGVHQTRWDRRDATGAPVAPGVYFGRLTGADGSAVSRVVILP